MLKILPFLVLFTPFIYSQDNCNLKSSSFHSISKVNSSNLICLSEKDTNKTIIYTFGSWCYPSKKGLPNAIKLAKEYNLTLYVLLVDKETDEKAKEAIQYLTKLDKDINIVILSDDYYPYKSRNRKYKAFLKEITPKKFKNINGMGKYILLVNGNVKMVTTWKDNKQYNWDKSKMILEKIVPLLN